MIDAPAIPATEVTVIVVSYNHASYVTDALDSVAGQTLRPSRVIIADDASSDESVAVIRAWIVDHDALARFDVRTIFHDTNAGLCSTLNEALALVETPLYTYLSADDRMLPHRLAVQEERWKRHTPRAGAVYSDAYRIDELGRHKHPNYGVLSNWQAVSSFEGHLHTALLRHNWIPAASVLLATDAVRGVGCYNHAWFYEDHDLWLRLAAAGYEILRVDEPLVDVRELASSLGNTNFGADKPLHLAARLGILLDHYGVSKEGDAYIHTVAPDLAVRLWRTGQRPDLVRAALSLPGLGRFPRWWGRVLLIRLGVTRQPSAPRWLRRARAMARGGAK